MRGERALETAPIQSSRTTGFVLPCGGGGAVEAIKGVPLSCQGIRGRAILIWVNDQPWIVSDLHKGNIMRDAEGRPTIIDALTGAIPPLAYDRLRQVREAVQDARDLREGRPPQARFKFEDVNDEEL